MAIIEVEKSAVGIRNDVNALGASKFVVFGAAPGVDAYALIAAQVALCKTAGGGTVVLPFIGGVGYYVSDTILIDASNISIVLCDKLTLTKNTRAAAIVFRGVFGTHISNVSLIGVGAVQTVDGNGPGMTGGGGLPAYSDLADDGTASFAYSAVAFIWCDNWRVEGIHATKGLMNSLRFVQCGVGKGKRCRASYAVYDNGISVDFNPSNKTFSDSDPETWSNAVFEDCTANHNESLGFTAYGAVGVKFIRPLSYANGNDDPSLPHNGGGLSVENDLRNMARNARCTIIDPMILGNYSYGIFVSVAGASVSGGSVEATILPSARIAALGDVTSTKGANVTVIGSGSIKISKTQLSRAGASNLRALAIGGSGVGSTTSGSNQLVLASGSGFQLGVILRGSGIPAGTTITAGPAGGGAGTYTMSANATATASGVTVNWELFPSVDFDGYADAPTVHNFDLQGINDVVISPASRLTLAGNGTGFTGMHINASNVGSVYNPGGGFIRLSGQLERSMGFAADINTIGQVFLDGIYIRDPRMGNSAGAAIRVQSASRAYVNNITGRDGNTKTTYAIDLQSTVAAAFVGKVAYSATGLTAPVLNNAVAAITSN